MAVLCEPPGPGFAEVATSLGLEPPDPADHTEVFVHQLVPYASVYLGEEGKIGGEAQDRIAGYWNALRLTPPAEPDHLASLLALLAGLIDTVETSEPARTLVDLAREAFVWEHLVPWLLPYLARVGEIGSSTYRDWSRIVSRVVIEECGRGMGVAPSHFRAATELDADGIEAELLVPMRSGLILTRSDLTRAAAELGLGLRMGERRYILDALFRQNRRGTIGWLADEADRQATLWSEVRGPSVVRRHWASRATRTATVLRLGAN